jgi:hypothetical protein
MKTEYAHVKLPQNTIAGATVTALSARAGTTLTRVTEDGRDDLEVRVEGNPRRSFDIAWSHIKGGVRADGPASTWNKPGTKRAPVVEDSPAVEPVDDTVRLTKRKSA